VRPVYRGGYLGVEAPGAEVPVEVVPGTAEEDQ